MHGKILLRKAHGDRIFILIREKYKKHENIFDSKPNNILFKFIFYQYFSKGAFNYYVCTQGGGVGPSKCDRMRSGGGEVGHHCERSHIFFLIEHLVYKLLTTVTLFFS